jgi:hypothetical protein
MAKKLEEIEWMRFPDPHGGIEWRVVLTTPQLCAHEEIRSCWAFALCVFQEYTIYIDAGHTEDEIGESLQHELFHVARGRRVKQSAHNKDHKFFDKTSPIVWGIWKLLGLRPMKRMPRGWKTLQRSSIAHKAHREAGE